MQATLKPTMGTGRAEQLQFLRFFAFLHVFLYHCDQWNVFGYPTANGGVIAVSFFFILSGLVTGYSGYGKEVRISCKTMGRYLWRKLKKIYPLYFVTILLYVTLSPLPGRLGRMDFAAAREELVQLGKCLLLIQSWFTEGYFAINGVAWFVSTLLFLSLFNLPGLWLLNRMNRSGKRLWLFASVLGLLLGITVVYCRMTRGWDIGYWHYIFPPARLGEYLSGMILGFGIRSMEWNHSEKEEKVWLFTLLEGGALLLWLYFLPKLGSPWRRHIVNWLIPNLFLLGVFTLGRGKVSQLFRWKPLVRLGDISYECFLIHNIIVIRFGFYNPVTTEEPLGCILATVLCLGLTILIALQLNKAASK